MSSAWSRQRPAGSSASASPASEGSAKPLLYVSPTCPFAQRAWIALLEAKVPFQHEIIDLKRKPAEFLELSPTGLVPLLQLEDGSVVTESVPVARRIATALDKSGRLMPGEAASRIDSFCQHWTAKVEPAYYDILRAGSEPQVHVATAAFVSTLSQVEKRLQGAATDAAAPAAFLLSHLLTARASSV